MEPIPASSILPDAYGSRIVSSEAEQTVDYMFGHYGYVDSDALLSSGDFDAWLRQRYRGTFNHRNLIDSEFVFLWVMKNIIEHRGNVLAGLNHALYQISIKRIPSCLNILFHDGESVFSYSNNKDELLFHRPQYIIAYKFQGNLFNPENYKLCRWDKSPDNWIINAEHNLYQYSGQEEPKIFQQFDRSIWGKLNL